MICPNSGPRLTGRSGGAVGRGWRSGGWRAHQHLGAWDPPPPGELPWPLSVVGILPNAKDLVPSLCLLRAVLGLWEVCFCQEQEDDLGDRKRKRTSKGPREEHGKGNDRTESSLYMLAVTPNIHHYLKLPNSPRRVGPCSFPFYRWGKLRLRLSKVTQLRKRSSVIITCCIMNYPKVRGLKQLFLFIIFCYLTVF